MYGSGNSADDFHKILFIYSKNMKNCFGFFFEETLRDLYSRFDK